MTNRMSTLGQPSFGAEVVVSAPTSSLGPASESDSDAELVGVAVVEALAVSVAAVVGSPVAVVVAGVVAVVTVVDAEALAESPPASPHAVSRARGRRGADRRRCSIACIDTTRARPGTSGPA